MKNFSIKNALIIFSIFFILWFLFTRFSKYRESIGGGRGGGVGGRFGGGVGRGGIGMRQFGGRGRIANRGFGRRWYRYNRRPYYGYGLGGLGLGYGLGNYYDYNYYPVYTPVYTTPVYTTPVYIDENNNSVNNSFYYKWIYPYLFGNLNK